MEKAEELHPEDSTYGYIQEVRSRMINGVLIAFACVSPVMLAISLTRAMQHGWQLIYMVHCGLAIVTFAGAVFRNKLSYRVRVSLFLGIAFILGSLGLPAFGLVGGGHIILVMFSILAAIGFGTRAGMIATFINIILMTGMAFAVCTGRLTFAFDIAEYAVSPSAWSAVIIDFILIVPMVVLAIGSVYNQLQTTLKGVRDSHASHQRLADNLTNSFLYRYSGPGKVEYASSSVEQILGYSPEEFTNLPRFLTPHPSNKASFTLPEQIDKDEKRAPFEVQVYHENGSKRWLHLSETIVQTPSGIKAEGVAHDITRRRIRETAIENILKTFSVDSGQKFYETMMTQLAETLECEIAFYGYKTADAEHTVRTEALIIDGSISSNIEYKIKGSPCADMVPAEVTICESGIQKAYPEADFLKKHNIQGYAGISVNDSHGKRIGYMVALWKDPALDYGLIEAVFKMYAKNLTTEYERQIEEKKHAMLEEQLRQSQKMDAVGQLAGGIAHDFNNMLMGIMGASEMLKMRLNEDAEAHEYHSMIMSSSRRAADLTRQLLTFARKKSIGSTKADIHESIKNAVALLSSTLDRRIHIGINLLAAESMITGDSTQLQNTIMNLGINAAHSMSDGGQIFITTEVQSFDQARCDSSTFSLVPGKYIIITVQDEGCGIHTRDLEKIFEPFFTTKALGEGTGLGLSTVLGTIQQHHGEISVDSEINVGTTFTLSLPLCASTNDSEQITENPVSGSGRILLVEDEPMIQETVSEMLSQLGYEVTIAENGQVGIDRFKEASGRFDLVILDMVMPKMSGRECFFKMKEIDADTRVILCSGFADDNDVREMKASGLCGCITKPFSSANLSQTVYKVLRG